MPVFVIFFHNEHPYGTIGPTVYPRCKTRTYQAQVTVITYQ